MRAFGLFVLTGWLLVGCTAKTAVVTPSIDNSNLVVLSFTDLRGTLKPCGCSPDLRKGGVDRIAYFMDRRKEKEPHALIFHAGNLLLDDEGIPKERSAQIELRNKTLAKSLDHIGVTAATLGEYDLQQGFSWLSARARELRMPLVASNVSGDDWTSFSQQTLIFDRGVARVGVIGLLPPGAGVTDPLEATRRHAAFLRNKGATVIVVLSSLGLRKAKRLVRKKLDVDLFIAAGQDLQSEVSDEMELFGKTRLIQSHVQGGHIGRTVVRPDPKKNQLAYTHQLTAIGWDRPNKQVVTNLMKSYDKQLKEINLKAAGTLPPLKPGQAHYVGVEVCMDCHTETMDFWENDKHAVAWKTLEDDGKTFDLECVSCHVTGYGEPGGSILGNLKNLTSVQCESCHGPGSIHAKDEDAASILLRPPESLCVTCHNPKHSTRFEYETYMSRLIVPGHGK